MCAQTVTLDGQTYSLTFADEFNGTDMRAWQGHGSSGIWSTSFSPHLHDGRYISVNGEGQYYIDPDADGLNSPFSVSNGVLSINASELTAAEQALADGQEYGSGFMSSQMTFSAEGGYVEIRADVPDQQGFLSAFWMLPEDGSWSSEIDVFEILGSSTDTLHTNVWENGVGDQESISTTDLSTGFHTYGLQWTDSEVTWFLDGVEVRSEAISLTSDMYLALSLAVDTTWTGDVDATTDFSDPLQVDYIRYYEIPAEAENPVHNFGTDFTPTKGYGKQNHAEALYGTRWADTIEGGGGDDKIFGRKGADTLHGGDGKDELFGQKGTDMLMGDAGDDKLIGGKGEDVLIGGTGTDHLWGGNWAADGETDHFEFEVGGGKDFVHDFEVGTDVVDLTAFATDWSALSAVMQDHSWATYVDLSALGGVSGDKLYLIGTDTSALSATDFEFGLLV
ncbi:MAG: family 16 glycosylhydrolase [Pseudomonadota bacterium]